MASPATCGEHKFLRSGLSSAGFTVRLMGLGVTGAGKHRDYVLGQQAPRWSTLCCVLYVICRNTLEDVDGPALQPTASGTKLEKGTGRDLRKEAADA